MNEGSDLLQPRSWERLHEAVSNTSAFEGRGDLDR